MRKDSLFNFSYDKDKTTYERVDWWIERSHSPEHQAAYDIISREIPLKSDQVFLEVASGSGEMLKRVYGKTKKIFAIDISERMLKLSMENLQKEGISADIIPVPLTLRELKSEVNNPRVALMQDDILNLTLPSDFFDHALLTLPDLRTHKTTPFMRGFITEALSDQNTTKDIGAIKAAASQLQTHFNMLQLVRRYAIVSYALYGGRDKFEDVRYIMSPFVNIRRYRFVNEPRFKQDVGRKIDDDQYGYQIITCGKKSHTQAIQSFLSKFDRYVDGS